MPSMMAGYDQAPLKAWEIVLRLAAAIMLMAAAPMVYGVGLALFALLVGRRFVGVRSATSQSR